MTVYLDTSSLIKLYVNESGSDAVRRLVKRATIVATSVITYAQALAGLARLQRERALTAAEHQTAKGDLDRDWPRYLTLDVTTSITLTAGDLTERYRLRGYDSVQLASFGEVLRRAGTGVRFSSFDTRLNQAAASLRRRSCRKR